MKQRLGRLLAGLLAVSGTAAAFAGEAVLRERPDGGSVITDAPVSGTSGTQAPRPRSAPHQKASGRGEGDPSERSAARPDATGQGGSVAEPDYAVTIENPGPDAVIWADDARLSVTVAVSPPIEGDHRLRVVVGDRASATFGEAGDVVVHPVHRGTHALVAEVVGADGERLVRTPPRMIHVKQHSRLHPGGG